MGQVWQDLTGTQQPVFKVGQHRFVSADSFQLQPRYGGDPVLSASPSTFSVLDISYSKSSAPPVTGAHKQGDIVWNTNPQTGILGWCCIQQGEPGNWQSIQLQPRISNTDPDTIYVSVYDTDTNEWAGLSIKDLQISTSDLIEADTHRFVPIDSYNSLLNLRGVNTGDETRDTILAKLGPATEHEPGYLSPSDVLQLRAAYSYLLDLSQQPAHIPVTKLSQLDNDLSFVNRDELSFEISKAVGSISTVSREEMLDYIDQVQSSFYSQVEVSLPKRLSELVNDSGFVTADDFRHIYLDYLADVDLATSSILHGDFLSYDMYKKAWTAKTLKVVNSVNGRRGILTGDITLTTADILEDSEKLFFTYDRVEGWLMETLPNISIQLLKDVELTNQKQGSVLAFADGIWRPFSVSELPDFTFANLTGVDVDKPDQYDTLIYEDGVWRTRSLSYSPLFNLSNLQDVLVSDPQHLEILVYDNYYQQWRNAPASALVSGESLDANLYVTKSYLKQELQDLENALPIADNSLSLSKLSAVSPLSLIGNPTLAPDSVIPIQIGAGLSLQGGVLSVSQGSLINLADLQDVELNLDLLTKDSLLGFDPSSGKWGAVNLEQPVLSVVGQKGDITARQLSEALSVLSGDERIDYQSLKNRPTSLVDDDGFIQLDRLSNINTMHLLGNIAATKDQVRAVALGSRFFIDGDGYLSVSIPHKHPHTHNVVVSWGDEAGSGFFETDLDDTYNVDDGGNGGSNPNPPIEIDLSAFMAKVVYDTDLDGSVNSAHKIKDVDTAGSLKYYGTNFSGLSGFFTFPVVSVAGLYGEITAASLASALNALTGLNRLDYNSLQNKPLGAGSALTIQEEGVSLGTATKLNFSNAQVELVEETATITPVGGGTGLSSSQKVMLALALVRGF